MYKTTAKLKYNNCRCIIFQKSKHQHNKCCTELKFAVLNRRVSFTTALHFYKSSFFHIGVTYITQKD